MQDELARHRISDALREGADDQQADEARRGGQDARRDQDSGNGG